MSKFYVYSFDYPLATDETTAFIVQTIKSQQLVDRGWYEFEYLNETANSILEFLNAHKFDTFTYTDSDIKDLRLKYDGTDYKFIKIDNATETAHNLTADGNKIAEDKMVDLDAGEFIVAHPVQPSNLVLNLSPGYAAHDLVIWNGDSSACNYTNFTVVDDNGTNVAKTSNSGSGIDSIIELTTPLQITRVVSVYYKLDSAIPTNIDIIVEYSTTSDFSNIIESKTVKVKGYIINKYKRMEIYNTTTDMSNVYVRFRFVDIGSDTYNLYIKEIKQREINLPMVGAVGIVNENYLIQHNYPLDGYIMDETNAQMYICEDADVAHIPVDMLKYITRFTIHLNFMMSEVTSDQVIFSFNNYGNILYLKYSTTSGLQVVIGSDIYDVPGFMFNVFMNVDIVVDYSLLRVYINDSIKVNTTITTLPQFEQYVNLKMIASIAVKLREFTVYSKALSDSEFRSYTTVDYMDHPNLPISSTTAAHGIKQGSGNGFDADTVDGYHANLLSSSISWGYIPIVNSTGYMDIGRYLDFHYSSGESADYTTRLSIDNVGILYRNGYKVWDENSDGSGSGLDADKLDGHDGSYFLASTAKAVDSDKLDGYDSTQYYRSQIGSQVDTDDWNNLTTFGTYKVQNASGANKPPSNYPYGILEVIVAEINGENRLMQRYTPHHSDNYIYERMRNQSSWGSWYKIWRNGTGSGSGLDADTLDGYTGDAFSQKGFAYITATLSIDLTPSTWTEIKFQQIDINKRLNGTLGSYDSATGRFTPNVAGYYFVIAHLGFAYIDGGYSCGAKVSKNGISNNTNTDIGIYWSSKADAVSNNFSNHSEATMIIYCNGVNDYISCFGYHNDPNNNGKIYGERAFSHLIIFYLGA